MFICRYISNSNSSKAAVNWCRTGRLVYPEPITHDMMEDRSKLLKAAKSHCTFMLGSQASDIENHDLSYEAYVEVSASCCSTAYRFQFAFVV
jgi:hypothetical protein